MATMTALAEATVAERAGSDAAACARLIVHDVEHRVGAWHPDAALARAMLGEILLFGGDADEGLEQLHSAELRLRDRRGSLSLRAADLLDLEGLSLRDRGRLPEAGQAFREAMAIRRRELGDDDPAVALSLEHLASLQDTPADTAEVLLRHAASILDHAPDDYAELTARVFHDLGSVLLSEGKYVEARAALAHAAALRASDDGERDRLAPVFPSW
ncbi:MAG: tetratricopeptide repeat protein [Deltaproteobacteria bacterium]|nr:tetratricopeptide repeat protein [Deltaproteobacteria bacterium]